MTFESPNSDNQELDCHIPLPDPLAIVTGKQNKYEK